MVLACLWRTPLAMKQDVLNTFRFSCVAVHGSHQIILRHGTISPFFCQQFEEKSITWPNGTRRLICVGYNYTKLTVCNYTGQPTARIGACREALVFISRVPEFTCISLHKTSSASMNLAPTSLSWYISLELLFLPAPSIEPCPYSLWSALSNPRMLWRSKVLWSYKQRVHVPIITSTLINHKLFL